MGSPNSRRARRRHRGKYRQFYANNVFVAGRWLRVSIIKTDEGGFNETWEAPRFPTNPRAMFMSNGEAINSGF